jgi:hypothetical protein
MGTIGSMAAGIGSLGTLGFGGSGGGATGYGSADLTPYPYYVGPR